MFCGGLLFLFSPILSIFDKPAFVFGLPVTYVVLYGFWGLVIAAVAFGARRKAAGNDQGAAGVPLNKPRGGA